MTTPIDKIEDYDMVAIRPMGKDFDKLDDYFQLIDEAYSRLGLKAGVFKPPSRRVHNKQEVLDTVSDGWMIGMLDKSELVGTISLVPKNKPKPGSSLISIHLLAISNTMCGKGLGKKLVLYIEKFLRLRFPNDSIRIELEAVEEHQLQLFYEKCGYTQFERDHKNAGVWGSCRDFHIVKMYKEI